MTINSLVKESYIPEGSRTNRLSYKDLWDQLVVVESASCQHTNDCVSCRTNRVSVTQASGNYVHKLSTHAIFTLCNYADQGIRLIHQLVKDVISPLWPKHKPISGKDTFGVRINVRTRTMKRSRNLLTRMGLRAHICAHILKSSFVGAASRAILRIS